MDQSVDKKPVLKKNLKNFFNHYKKKIFFVLILIMIIPLAVLIQNEKEDKKNLVISEKYVKAGVLLSNNKKAKAIKQYEEIILDKNNFYSLLALNVIIEKNLIQNENKILGYFKIIENLDYKKDKKDLIKYKKALFLFKSKKNQEGEEILKNLIKNDSNFKSAAEEFLKE